MTMRSLALFLAMYGVEAAKKAEPEPAGNPIVDHVQALLQDAAQATLGAGEDILGYVLASPRFLVDFYVQVVAYARAVPGMVKDVYAGDAATTDSMLSFCTHAATTMFAVTASLTALNLLLALFAQVKNSVKDRMILPKTILGKPLPPGVVDVRNLIQDQILNRIRSFEVKSWIVPLEGQTGAPTLKGATPVLAGAVSACMLLSCAPAVHALMKGGANKADAEALAWTAGTALGIQYLVKVAA